MSKKQIIDIDLEFDDVEFDEKSIMGTTSAYNRSNDPTWIAKITAINRARAQDPESLAKHRATMQSDEYKRAHRAGCQSPENLARSKQRTTELWTDPEYRKAQEERLASPEVKEQQRAAARKREANPEFKKRKMEAITPTYKDPARNKKISDKRKAYIEANPEVRKELSDRAKKSHAGRTKEDYKQFDAKRKSNGTWSEAVKQAGKRRRKPLLTPNGVFDSKKEAHLHYGFDPAMVDYNRNKNPNEWFFITVEDYEKCLSNPKHIIKLRKLRLAGEYSEQLVITKGHN